MSFNREAVTEAKAFVNQLGGHESDPWSLFPTIKIFPGEKHRGRFLTSSKLTVDLWIHQWKAGNHTRTLCEAAHYKRECPICQMRNPKWDKPCYPDYMRLALFWDYSLIGKTWTPKSGPSQGVEQPISPFGVISVPKGEGYCNWAKMDEANTMGFGWPDSPNQSCVWEFQHIPEVGFQVPAPLPAEVLGGIPQQIDPGILQWIAAASEDEIIAQLFATCYGVEYEKFGLPVPPERQKQQQAGGQANAAQGGTNKPRGRSGGSKQAVAAPAQPQPQAFGNPNMPVAQQSQAPVQGFPGQAQTGFVPQAQTQFVQQPGFPAGGFQPQQLQQDFQAASQGFPVPGSDGGTQFNQVPPAMQQAGQGFNPNEGAPAPGPAPFGAPQGAIQPAPFGATADPSALATSRASAALAALQAPVPEQFQQPAQEQMQQQYVQQQQFQQPAPQQQFAQQQPVQSAGFPTQFQQPPQQQFQQPQQQAQQPAQSQEMDEVARLKAQLAALQAQEGAGAPQQGEARRTLVPGS